MGGKAFSQPKGDQPALQTPRMNLEVYNRIRTFAIKQLQEYFDAVIAPAEVPQKPDYGDVDTLVQDPKPGFTWEKVASCLNAERTANNGDSHSFAVPIDHDDAAARTYAQVDVHICSSGFIEWECLLNSYGDLFQIIGRFLRAAGLTATDKGLHVRIPEIERSNRKLSMVYLSHDVNDVLNFLGLDVDQYHRGFGTMEDLYSWCASGKFFHCDAFKANVENANDRMRLKKREMFREFNDEWMPGNTHRWKDREPHTREDVLQQALVYFGKKSVYDEKIFTWNAKQEEEELMSAFSTLISEEGQGDVNLVIRGLKRWVDFDSDGRPSILNEAEMDSVNQPLWAAHVTSTDGETGVSKDFLLEWVREHWREIKGLEKARVTTMKAKHS